MACGWNTLIYRTQKVSIDIIIRDRSEKNQIDRYKYVIDSMVCFYTFWVLLNLCKTCGLRYLEDGVKGNWKTILTYNKTNLKQNIKKYK